METITKILRKFSPDAKYFEKFETGIINTKIPDGNYLVTVTYNMDSKEIIVKNIKFNGLDITVYDQYIPNHEGIDEFFSKVYARIATNLRKQYTIDNLKDLLKIKNEYSEFQENANSTVRHYLSSIKDTSILSWVASLTVVTTLESIYNNSNNYLNRHETFNEEDRKFLIEKNSENIIDMAGKVATRVKKLIASNSAAGREDYFDVDALRLSLEPIIADLNKLRDHTITDDELNLLKTLVNKKSTKG